MGRTKKSYNLQLRRMRAEGGYKTRHAFIVALEAAGIGDITERRVIGWEVGERMPSIECLCELADFFDCTLDELCGRNAMPIEYEDTDMQTVCDLISSLPLRDRSKVEEYARLLSNRRLLETLPPRLEKLGLVEPIARRAGDGDGDPE